MDRTVIALVVSSIVTLVSFIAPRTTKFTLHRPVLFSSFGAVLLFVLRFIYLSTAEGTVIWSREVDNILAAVGTLLTINGVIELIKWLVMQVTENRGLRVPRFLLDVIGLVTLSLFVPTVANRFFGVDLNGLLVGSTVVSAIIALSLQSLLSSFFAGIALQIESPFRPDDWVEVDGQEGRVVRMNWRTLALVTRRNEAIILPNGNVAQQKIINYSRPSQLQAIDVFIGVAYRHPPGAVKALLKSTTEQVPGVVSDRPVEVMLWEYADSSINYRVRFWIKDYRRKYELTDQVQTRFWYALQRASYEIPFPQRDVHFYPVDDTVDEEAEALEHAALAKLLKELDLFSRFSDEQCLVLARGTQKRTYTQGEVLMRQGESGDSLFLIVSGELSVLKIDAHGHEIPLSNRTTGEFLGEMGLLTGDPRAATVRASAETEVVVIEAETFREVVAEDRAILDRLMEALEQRRSNTESILAEHLSAESTPTKQNRDFIHRVYRFLGL